MKLPYFAAAVKAGFPSPAQDYIEDRIDLNDLFIKHPHSTFIVECSGDSMIDAFIPPKAKLIVDRSLTANNGDIVLAVLNGEFTVKYPQKNFAKTKLIPANKKYHDIEMQEGMQMEVWGVVTGIMIDPKDCKPCMGW
ncbi:MAG: translesion error-prone DNA polymerase V autoproteolytic subunit [Bacteroidota bacterium]|nr:translesion error-prone DNA polymerase V autoproteolytic subunit [Bacteroidota bacterium]